MYVLDTVPLLDNVVDDDSEVLVLETVPLLENLIDDDGFCIDCRYILEQDRFTIFFSFEIFPYLIGLRNLSSCICQ